MFAPDKYKLIHFTRRRNADVTAQTNIPGFDGKPVESLRVLGVQVDSKLSWSAHIAQAAQKGEAQFTALSRLVASTWGLTFARARLIYTAVVRPTIAYAGSIWSSCEATQGQRQKRLQPLVKLQNQCLRKITGAYKRTNITALEKNADIPPLLAYLKLQAYKHAITQRNTPAEKFITSRACISINFLYS